MDITAKLVSSERNPPISRFNRFRKSGLNLHLEVFLSPPGQE